MILVFGGAYNGKKDFIKEKFNINEEDIFYCSDGEIDFSKKVICGLHKFTYNNTLKNKSSLEYIKENINLFKDKIIISDEISSGIVPLKKEDRMWREETGRCLQYLSKESSCVYRVFCGISTIIKS
ncbi:MULTISPECIES: bifunctional adenosylcobinamide kinase/adenosylcobinamide-phosphate guanylyltransferase [Clostridium]|jgi:adenosylcobinamide kinase/adenosylcobinamide-phosphate guanylyltransferase|uniref:Cobalamin biosynthesis protein CobU n=1 Tax=Clostridium disporicum TaxID=84024 RepID=A0A174IKK3_9CLOT|nr:MULTISPECIES: bifunctional adenosylcobinamide kinase/adenosylcobinamide-phosphate guanylyltransferase [Clostridium]MBX9184702.1 cobalamin biosynthesis protein CobU [Clostridium sp. K04]MDU3521081.1 bifunctional adenosylcobinamide kinase/adenosylcobinamide-phosphate guanylyltransferase [Clostridium saudiense]MDU7453446.1 bifunctional adenosylcobinamide kinase/adenosylcobinamide-phosphate guanylyltransferase [Clostridium saudiense]CUO45535.1 cobalamin biosynthesis protein CobU [Clostridium dis